MSVTKISLSKGSMQQCRYFVTGLNTSVGQEIVELLRNDNENDVNPHIIVGTIDPNDPSDVPRGIKTVINVEHIVDYRLRTRIFSQEFCWILMQLYLMFKIRRLMKSNSL